MVIDICHPGAQRVVDHNLQFLSCNLTEIISKIKMKDTLNSQLKSNTDVIKQQTR